MNIKYWFAVLALPMTPGAVVAKEPLDSAGLKALEAKAPPQSWYPDGYYDVRIAAEGQVADFPRPADEMMMDWGDGSPLHYDVIDCNAEAPVLDPGDPVTSRYGATALAIARLRNEFERLKYPLATYAGPLLVLEKALIENDTKRLDLPVDEAAADAAGSEAEDAYEDARYQAYVALAAAVEANRARLAPKLPPVVAEGGCGAGDGGPIIIKTAPPGGEVLLVNAFAFKVCTRKQPDPWDRFKCKWTEIETGTEKQLAGRYVYQVRWPDGTVRKGTRDIVPDYGTEEAVTVTFKKTGS